MNDPRYSYPEQRAKGENRPRGLGDVIATMTKAVGIPQCAGCKKRQETLNKIVPFAPQSS